MYKVCVALYQYYDLAADVLAENAHLVYKYLTPASISYLGSSCDS